MEQRLKENLYGLMGEHLGHSYSPTIHKMILEAVHINGHYGLFEVQPKNLRDVVPGLKALGYKGINITIPYKHDLIEYLDDLTPEASKIGAVNVIKLDADGKATGYNSDYYGFGMMLKKAAIPITGEGIVVLGTGGASKAVVQYLKDNDAKDIILVTRDVEAAKRKYPTEIIVTYEELNNINNCSVIINCTPVGMYPHVNNCPIDTSCVKNFKSAVDLIYNPTETMFLKQCKSEGLKTTNGLYMLVAQAVKSQEIWNDIKIPDEAIENIVNKIHRSAYE
jgi:shikimate dehydrogenase